MKIRLNNRNSLIVRTKIHNNNMIKEEIKIKDNNNNKIIRLLSFKIKIFNNNFKIYSKIIISSIIKTHKINILTNRIL
jgi:hypothetical protein